MNTTFGHILSTSGQCLWVVLSYR